MLKAKCNIIEHKFKMDFPTESEHELIFNIHRSAIDNTRTSTRTYNDVSGGRILFQYMKIYQYLGKTIESSLELAQLYRTTHEILQKYFRGSIFSLSR